MIYGINFNGLRIPESVIGKFAARLNSGFNAVSHNHGCTWALQGVCESRGELGRMMIQANNGRRAFHVVERDGWLALYIGPLGSIACDHSEGWQAIGNNPAVERCSKCRTQRKRIERQ